MVSKTQRSVLYTWLTCLLLLANLKAQTQSSNALTIDSCYAMAIRNYPLVKQHALLQQSKAYSLDNAAKGYLPQLSIAGQATYQSDVTKVPISLPGLNIPTISKDQYRLYGEVVQPVTDLFTVKDQKNLIKANTAAEEQKVEVELFKLKERINQLFFGILLIDGQVEQTELLKKDIQTGLNKTNAAIANGIALKSNADLLQAELLKANQRTIELKANRKGYANMLSLFIGQTVDENTLVERPAVLSLSENIKRPELLLYDLQKKTFDAQSKLVNARVLPRFNLFFQGGVGRPGLNMLDNGAAGYYITGLRLNWNLTAFYTFGKDKKILELNRNVLDLQQETFLFNTKVILNQQNAEVAKLQELVNTDSEIIRLRENVINTAKNQLDNGTATTNDYLGYVNAGDQAKQNLLLHQIQLLMAQYNYQNTTGN